MRTRTSDVWVDLTDASPVCLDRAIALSPRLPHKQDDLSSGPVVGVIVLLGGALVSVCTAVGAVTICRAAIALLGG